MSRYSNAKFRAKDGHRLDAESALYDGYLDVSGDASGNSSFVGKFVANLAAGTANVGIVAGVFSKVSIQGAGAKVSDRAASIWAVVDNSAGANVAANTVYGIIIEDKRDGANSAIGTTAWFSLLETRFNANSVLNPVAFLLDIGRVGANVTPGNTTSFLTTGGANVTQAAVVASLRVRVNGATRYIPLCDTLA